MAYIKNVWQDGETIATAERMNHIEDGIYNIYNNIFPIGRGFIDFTNTDFSNYLGFTWERTLVGMTPVGIDSTDTDFNTIGKTGGEKTHKLTIAEMPKHVHDVKYGSSAPLGLNSGSTGYKLNYEVGGTQQIYASATGGDNPHNNLQPYQVVAYWKRIA